MSRLLLIVIPLLFFGCKKNKISKIEGNFLCEIISNQSFTGNNSTAKYDYVLSTKVENDLIIFYGYEFPMSEYNRRTGSGSHTISDNSNTVTLTFSNDFKDIYLKVYSPSTLYGPSSTTTILGTSTELDPTDESNPLLSQSGTYNLSVQKLRTNLDIDTTYTGAYSVTYDPLTESLDIDGETHSLPRFYSHFNKITHADVSFGYLTKLEDISWVNDCISFDYFETITNFPNGDTTHYYYQGLKQ